MRAHPDQLQVREMIHGGPRRPGRACRPVTGRWKGRSMKGRSLTQQVNSKPA